MDFKQIGDTKFGSIGIQLQSPETLLDSPMVWVYSVRNLN